MSFAVLQSRVTPYYESALQHVQKWVAQGRTKVEEVSQKVAALVKPTAAEKPCAFCKAEVIDMQRVLDEHSFYVVADYAPITPGHLLIMPKNHIQRMEELTDAESAQLNKLVKKAVAAFEALYGTKDYIYLVKNGKAAGQTVPHLHVHLIPITSANSKMLGQIKTLGRIVFGSSPCKKEVLEKTVEQYQAHFSGMK